MKAKKERVAVMMDEDEKAELEQAAERKSVPLSTFIRSSALDAARAVNKEE